MEKMISLLFSISNVRSHARIVMLMQFYQYSDVKGANFIFNTYFLKEVCLENNWENLLEVCFGNKYLEVENACHCQ